MPTKMSTNVWFFLNIFYDIMITYYHQISRKSADDVKRNIL